MAGDIICGAAFDTFRNGTIMPLAAAAAMATVMIAAVTFMAGRVTANAKLTLWAKTELVQLVVSLASLIFIVATVQSFCAVNMAEVAGYFGLSSAPMSVYDGALNYLGGTLNYTHNALQVVRYHLEAYMVLSYFNAFICDWNIGRIGLGCFFGYAGNSESPFGGYGTQMATLNAFYSTTLISHLGALNFLFILLFVYKGFVFLFLPLGVFMRAMPYMRSFGSLLIAVAMSFLIVYPFILAVFNLMGGVLLDRPNYAPAGISMSDYSEQVFPDNEGAGNQMVVSMGGEGAVKNIYFGGSRENLAGAVSFAGYAFLAAVFFPTAALLATIASVAYMTRLLGEEIDLSRLTQLV